MTHFTCLDGRHEVPLAADTTAAALLADARCPACPDSRCSSGRGGVLVCPCCWSAWWLEAGRVRCTPGAIAIEEPVLSAVR